MLLSYALVDLLEYAGPIQSLLRNLFNWQTSQDYWFPEIRSLSQQFLFVTRPLPLCLFDGALGIFRTIRFC